MLQAILVENNRWLTEVQFHCGDILKIKDAHHLYYELDRAAKDNLDMRLRPPIFTTFVWGRASAPKDWTDWLKA